MSIRKDRPITGSLKDRGGMYTAIINTYNGYGERKQKYHALGIPVKGNKRKAEAALQELIRKYESEDSKLARAKEDSPLFADFLTEWLGTIAPTIERTTRESYESMRKARLDSFFRERGLRLCEVESRHIRELHDSIFKDGCTANTVIHYHAVVRKALQYAVRNELIVSNPADMVDRPKLNKFIGSFYSQGELSRLFEATADDAMSLVIQLTAYYGLRRSEVLGLRWSSIDFKKGTLAVNHKVTEGVVDGKSELFTEDKLKTKSSFRTLPLIPCVRELLLEAQKNRRNIKRCSRATTAPSTRITSALTRWASCFARTMSPTISKRCSNEATCESYDSMI